MNGLNSSNSFPYGYKLETIFNKYISMTKDYAESIAEVIVGFLAFVQVISLKGKIVDVSNGIDLIGVNDLFVYSDLYFDYDYEEEMFEKSILHARKLIKQNKFVSDYCDKYNHKLTDFEKSFLNEFVSDNPLLSLSYKKKIFYNEIIDHISFYRVR